MEDKEQKNPFDEVISKVKGKFIELGEVTERNRIMKGILEADLPFGYWDRIKDIINPKEN